VELAGAMESLFEVSRCVQTEKMEQLFVISVTMNFTFAVVDKSNNFNSVFSWLMRAEVGKEMILRSD
jgi:hypothetical protein